MSYRSCRILAASLLASLAVHGPAHAQEQAATPAPTYSALVQEAQTLQQRKRFFDALTKLEEAEKLDPKHAEIYNVRGAVYLSSQMRDFDKARAEFNKAVALEPDAMPARFNLAESDYVQGRYADGEKGFGGLLEKFPKMPNAVRHLVLFKQIVCQLKQDKIAEAEKLMEANFTFMDDTPAYYLSKAALEFQKKDEAKGNGWLGKAQIIFKKGENSAYLDTLMEGHYLDSLTVAKPEPTDDKKKEGQ